jgi:ribosomal protein L37E
MKGQATEMNEPPSEPRCPRCGRRIAAWRLEHCVYCGAEFPAESRPAGPPPAALQWIERPGLPPDAARQVELLKVVPLERAPRSRSLLAIVSVVSVPVFGGIFYALYRLLSRHSAAAAGLVLVGGAAFILYLVYAAFRSNAGR